MKGEVRNPVTVLILSLVTCGMYGLYLFYVAGNELKEYLGKEDLKPTTDLIIALLCCFYGLYLPFKYGALIEEAQRKAGVPGAANPGVMILVLNWVLPGLGYWKMQGELNKIWESGGGAPATF